MIRGRRQPNARAFAQDIMRGEYVVDDSKMRAGALAEYFGLAPFSVLSARSGWWQTRKRAWIDLGIRSELGRDAAPGGSPRPLDRESEELDVGLGTSIFDPVLCEIAYRWFCPPNGTVLDPFAGGSVRGIVASVLGRNYLGIDLSERQIAANYKQSEAICDDPCPRWVVGDSRDVGKIVRAEEFSKFDFIFSCPPYFDLEIYSDDPRDLSTLDYSDFRRDYAMIIAKTCALLKQDRFACFVVGDVRDEDGMYRNFPGHTIEAFEAAGLRLYNDAILVTAVGSLPVRAGRAFRASRKLGCTHQNVLIFCKGDPVRATQAIGKVDFGEISTLEAGSSPAPLGDQLSFI